MRQRQRQGKCVTQRLRVATYAHIDIPCLQVRPVPPMTTEPVQTPVTRSPASHMDFFPIPDVWSCDGKQRLTSNSNGGMRITSRLNVAPTVASLLATTKTMTTELFDLHNEDNIGGVSNLVVVAVSSKKKGRRRSRLATQVFAVAMVSVVG
ncbi:unnamed protein product [Lactuca saligna]|uniref:Uncharacterized protein n=1 Tax=Lactuca saligna TaxID=75948 RepID=A0AA35V591_LACSI|nr:unnamed protein product [Lactuca saligna]